MASPRFVHLRLHSEFSITDGVVRIDDAVAQAEKDEMGALALTDLSNLFGLIRFYTAARAKGIKPIAGADVWVSNPQDPDQPHRLLLLVQNYINQNLHHYKCLYQYHKYYIKDLLLNQLLQMDFQQIEF